MTSFLGKRATLFSIFAVTFCGLVAAHEDKKSDEAPLQRKATERKDVKLPPATPLPSNTSPSKESNDAQVPDSLASILQARVKLAQKGYDAAVEMLKRTQRQGNTLVYIGKPEDVAQWSLNLLDAQRDIINRDSAGELVALEGHLKRMKQLEEQVDELSRDVVPKSEVWKAQWQRLNAQLWLTQAKAKSP